MTDLSKDGLEFDPKSLRAKYLAERDKRLRADGVEQYIPVSGKFAHFADDPYTPRIERDPIAKETEVAIIGGGFGGLLMGARLREAGVQDLSIIEKGGDFGGAWYGNRYPGASCDIESYIYIPILDELGYMPTEKYSKAPEIMAHAQAIARKYELYDGALLQTEVNEACWEDASARWIIKTNRNDVVKARYLILGAGFLQQPKPPGIASLDAFKGKAFHTSRWDYAYTGGDSNGKMTGLTDKIVGVVGAGATGIQCIPHVGAAAKNLYVFQRTPSAVDYRGNTPTDPEWFKSQEPGWQPKRMDNFNILVNGGHQDEDLVGDGWTYVFRNLPGVLVDGMPKEIAEPAQINDYRKMQAIRARIDEVVKDKTTAEALKPWYNQFCKRPCFHDQHLDTFNRPNVTLVDTDGRGVERVTEDGVIVGGKHYKLDCLIFATGFEVGADYKRHQHGCDRAPRDQHPGKMERRRHDAARHARERLSECLRDLRDGACRRHAELHQHIGRPHHAHRLYHRRSADEKCARTGSDAGSRKGLVRHHRRHVRACAALQRGMHAQLSQQ